MSLVETVTATDLLFLASVAALAAGATVYRFDVTPWGRGVTTAGWVAFACFWLVEARLYLLEGRGFLVIVTLVTAGVCVYLATLTARDRAIGRRFTVAFAAMGLLFIPYQFLVPVFHTVLGLVTAHTVWGLGLLGYEPTVGVGISGLPTAFRFPNYPRLRYNIISACTGFSAIALFVGLTTIGDEPRRRRAVVALAAGSFVYVMNVVRTVIVGSAVGGEWFAFTAPVITPLFGVTDPAVVSFYFAEYLFVQTLVVIVLLGLYAAVARALPSVHAHVVALLAAFETDLARVRNASAGLAFPDP